jgi:hypothetical protein
MDAQQRIMGAFSAPAGEGNGLERMLRDCGSSIRLHNR